MVRVMRDRYVRVDGAAGAAVGGASVEGREGWGKRYQMEHEYTERGERTLQCFRTEVDDRCDTEQDEKDRCRDRREDMPPRK